MRIPPAHAIAKTMIVMFIACFCLCGSVQAQSSPCGEQAGNACPSQCGNSGWKSFQFSNGGTQFGVNATIYCGSCGYSQANVYEGSMCSPTFGYGANQKEVKALLALANGHRVLVSACGDGFKPLVNPPSTIADVRWEPRALRSIEPSN